MSKWPRYPTIYEVDSWIWLSDLSQKAGTSVDLSCVPAAEWDAIADYGFDAVWLMGYISVLQPRSHASLTLITCYPFYFIGSAPQRYIVQASIVESATMNALAHARPLSIPEAVDHVVSAK